MKLIASINAPHFYCGIVLIDDRVIRAAPIVKYMIGWSRNRVREYCTKKCWIIEVC